MHELSLKLEEVVRDFRSKLPKSEGLILLPNARKAAKNRAKAVSKKYKSLPAKIKRGRIRSDWRIRNRVGAKVEQLRKVQ